MRTRPDGSLWRAVDETLERPRAGVQRTPSATRTAARSWTPPGARPWSRIPPATCPRRRPERGTPYVVPQPAPGRALAELLQNGPLPAETGRRIAGEASEAARACGHAGAAPPAPAADQPDRRPDGTVTVAGTAIDAAADGIESPSPARGGPLGRRRSRGAAYATPDRPWPGTQDVWRAAPRVAGRPVPPGDLVAVCPTTSTRSARSCSGPTTTARAVPASWRRSSRRGLPRHRSRTRAGCTSALPAAPPSPHPRCVRQAHDHDRRPPRCPPFSPAHPARRHPPSRHPPSRHRPPQQRQHRPQHRQRPRRRLRPLISCGASCGDRWAAQPRPAAGSPSRPQRPPWDRRADAPAPLGAPVPTPTALARPQAAPPRAEPQPVSPPPAAAPPSAAPPSAAPPPAAPPPAGPAAAPAPVRVSAAAATGPLPSRRPRTGPRTPAGGPARSRGRSPAGAAAPHQRVA